MYTHAIMAVVFCSMVLTVLSSLAASAEVKPAKIFSDHMVLQQGQAVPVWGTAPPGEQITVSFAGQTQHAVTGADGQWRVTLHALKASATPRELIVAGTNTVTFRDVLVGEVWLASGQSNMAMAVKSQRRGPVVNADAEIAAANWPNLRLFQVPINGEEQSPASNNWQPCTPQTVPLFSAVAYFYARDLHTALHVPVGIISSALGGSAIASWMPPDGNLYQEDLKPLCPYGMCGMIWYQGESDPRLSYSDEQRTLVSRLRALWGIGDFPFYYVQIAPAIDFAPNELPLLWQAQLKALDVPNCYLAAQGDNGVNLHPPDKQKVGDRLTRIALALTYRKTKNEYSAPVYRSMQVKNGKVRLTFDHAGGLRASDAGPLTWFTIAGDDRVFYPADAVIAGQDVLVASEKVPTPVAVRFAWDKLAEPNLENGAGLPAFAFRTDDWPVSTEEIKPFHTPVTVPHGPAAANLEAALPLLDKAPAQVLQRGGCEYARVAWAVAGDTLLMRMRVRDARINTANRDWQGAEIELYLSPTNSQTVRQVVCTLQGMGREPIVAGYEMGNPLDGNVSGTWRVTLETDGVYRLDAALPLAFFNIPAGADTFLVDAAVTAAPYRGQRPHFLWLFSPKSAFCNNTFFGLGTVH